MMIIVVVQGRHKPIIDEEDFGEEWLLSYHGEFVTTPIWKAKTVAF